jgi:hypothetical protein
MSGGFSVSGSSASSVAPGPDGSSSLNSSPVARPNWKKIILALHCLWNLSAYEENKPTFVLKGVVECLLGLLEGVRWLSNEKHKGDIFLCCSAILQNVSESHFRSGAMNQLQVRIMEEGALEPLLILSDPDQVRDISVRFKACLAICNLAYHEQNRQLMRKRKVFERVKKFLEPDNWEEAESRSSIWGSFLVLQPFVPLLRLSPPPNDPNDPFKYVQHFAFKCIEKFSSIDRYHKKLWHDLAMNGGVQPLKTILKSSPDPFLKQSIQNIFKNLGVDLADVGVSVGYSTFHHDIALALDRPDMFPDLVISCLHPLATCLDLDLDPRSPTVTVTDGAQSSLDLPLLRRDIYCHKVILASRCKVFATILSWDQRLPHSVPHLHSQPHSQSERGADDHTPSHPWTPGGAHGPTGLRTIEITEFDYTTMYKVLEYIYYDTTHLDWRCAVDVLRAADIYALERLKQMCEDVIIQGIDADNICDLLQVADIHSAPQLFHACLNFICNNQEEVESKSSLLSLLNAHPHLKEAIDREMKIRAARPANLKNKVPAPPSTPTTHTEPPVAPMNV